MKSAQKFIVWDWNGTLQDDLPVSIACANINLASIGRPPIDEDCYRQHFEVPIEQFYRNLGLSEQEMTDCFKATQDTYFHSYEKLIGERDFRPGGREILALIEQQEIINLILSNHVIEYIAKDLRRLNKSEAFHQILAWPNREAQFKHPKGELLASYMNDNQLDPAHGLIVGDTPEEVKVARTYGLISVAISGGYNALEQLQAAQPDYIIHDLHELQPILRERGFLS